MIALINRFTVYRRRRRTVLELARLDDEQLKDIGVARHDLFAPTLFR